MADHLPKALPRGQEHDCGWVYAHGPESHAYLVLVRHARRGHGYDVVRKSAGGEVLVVWHATLARAVQAGDVQVMEGNREVRE